jgi:histone deacetylase 1/2
MRLMEVDEEYVADVDLTRFHSDDYVDCLKNLSTEPETQAKYRDEIHRFNLNQEDCPVFNNMEDYCKRYTAGSLKCAVDVAEGQNDFSINWAGGLHHAKKFEASGFCYINDCVLAILQLLEYHERVLYVDIDCHHGDGVEEAFLTTNRVMTFSAHKFGNFFPGTGSLTDVGVDAGKFYSVNYPLNDGIDDFTYAMAMKPVLKEIMDRFKPNSIVL